MPRKRRERRPSYECDEPPCIHVVFDERRKIYKIFVEESDGTIVAIPLNKMSGACSLLEELVKEGFREAIDDYEVDFLARRYLKVVPVDQEEEYGEE